MTRFEDALVDLLLRHNCVIVPGFGGFVSQTNSAKVDLSKGVILPPKKSILFNRQLVNNDGLLVNYIAEQRKVPFQESEELVAIKVTDWKGKLNAGQRIELDRIGNLYLDSERNIQFEQDRFTNLLLESYGLDKIHFIGEEELQIVQQKTKSVTPEKGEEPAPIIDFAPSEIIEEKPTEGSVAVEAPKTSNLRSIVWKAAAAAVLIPVAFYSYWIPMETKVLESGIISLNDFNPNYRADDGGYDASTLKLELAEKENIQTLEERLALLPKQVEVYYYPYDEGMYIPVKLEEEAVEAAATEQKNVTPATNEGALGKWIVGSFSSEENARALKADLNKSGFSAEISSLKNGMVRVSAAVVRDEAHLKQVTEETNALGLDGWLLKF